MPGRHDPAKGIRFGDCEQFGLFCMALAVERYKLGVMNDIDFLLR